jgi:hypothetical protein
VNRDGHEPHPVIFAGAATGTDVSRADVEIDAKADARELRVLRAPRTRTGLFGNRGLLEERVSRRRNLPKRLRPGGVYSDVGIRRRVAARLSIGRGRS